MALRREAITWEEVEKLIDILTPQFGVEFTAMVMITRGGIIPGGMLAAALGIQKVLTAAVDFPASAEMEFQKAHQDSLLHFPQFIQFPEESLLRGENTLVVDDVWGSGRTIMAVKNRVAAARGYPYTCVLHFNPYRNRFESLRPDYFAAITDAYIVYPWERHRGPDRVLKDY
jgi:hypoxanthine phosphoribosyltransferase